MKKQITEIEREITEKSNRPISATAINPPTTSSSSSDVTMSAAVTASESSVSQSTFKPGSVVPSVNLSSQNNSNCSNPIIIESKTNDIDLELLDPLGSYLTSEFYFPDFFLQREGVILVYFAFQLPFWIDVHRRLLLQLRLRIEKTVHFNSN